MKNYYLSILCIYSLFSSINLSAQNQSALDFDGIDDAVILPGGAQLAANATQLSFSCWVKLNDNPTNSPRGIVGIRDDVSADFYLAQLSTTEVEARFRNSNNQNFTINHIGDVQTGAWQYYALTYDGSLMRLFIDGVLVDSLAASGQLGNSTGDLQIGYSEWNGGISQVPDRFELLGQLDEVGLWNRKLETEEIQCIKNTRISESSNGLLAYFNFNQGVPVSDNTTLLSIQNMLPTGDANLSGFALNGISSNFVEGNTFAVNAAVVQSGISLIAQNISATYQWINCTTNQLIPGAINQSYTPNVNGSYAALITQCGISDTSACFTFNNVGLEDLENDSEMLLYPNPATSSFTIQLPSNAELFHVRIFNMIGELVSSKLFHGNEIIVNDISQLSSGSYTVEVKSESRNWQKKLVVLQ